MGTTPQKSRADFLSPGDHNASCSMCGRKRKASQMERNWMGQYRCPEHNEPRQPQDFARDIKDDQSVPWAQLPQVTFTSFCTLNSQAALPDVGIADCMRADNTFYDPYGV